MCPECEAKAQVALIRAMKITYPGAAKKVLWQISESIEPACDEILQRVGAEERLQR